MKSSKEIGELYDLIHEVCILSLGDCPDFTAAFYGGDFSKSYEQAQIDKHEWVLKGIGFQPGQRILDVGSGWGPILKAIKDKGGNGTGLTVSRKQVKYCQERGLNAILQDWKDVDPAELRKFDGIVSIGALEHFCSVNEYLNRKQEKIYNEFFRFCHSCLKNKGGLFLQTMTWGDKVPDYPLEVDATAPRKSNARILGSVLDLLSNSWLPASEEQIVNAAASYFEPIEINRNGREDYIRTITEMDKAWRAPRKGKRIATLKAFGKILLNENLRGLRMKIETLQNQYFREAFIQHLIDDRRIFFKKK